MTNMNYKWLAGRVKDEILDGKSKKIDSCPGQIGYGKFTFLKCNHMRSRFCNYFLDSDSQNGCPCHWIDKDVLVKRLEYVEKNGIHRFIKSRRKVR